MPYKLSPEKVRDGISECVKAVTGQLESHFLELPKVTQFVTLRRFFAAYHALTNETDTFKKWTLDRVISAFRQDCFVFSVIRTMLGLSAPEWAYLATDRHQLEIKQGLARTWDQKFQERGSRKVTKQLNAMFETGVHLLRQPVPDVSNPFWKRLGLCDLEAIHRFDKIDTRNGITSIQQAASWQTSLKLGKGSLVRLKPPAGFAEGFSLEIEEYNEVSNLEVPMYVLLLYERYLGRPWASYRDSTSDIVGSFMETAVAKELSKHGILYQPVTRGFKDRPEDFDQLPDFFVPSAQNPVVVIEAKICEDDGTARDKVTRLQHLAGIAKKRSDAGGTGFQVVACIDGRGFGVRVEDMAKLLEATDGKVFTLATLSDLVEHTALAGLRKAVSGA